MREELSQMSGTASPSTTRFTICHHGLQILYCRMEIFPDTIHQRVPFAIGSLREIEEYKKSYAESCRD